MIEGLQARMIAKSLSTALLAHQVNSGWFEEVEIHQVIFDNQEEENHLQMFLVPFDQPKVIKRTLLKKVLNNLNLLKKSTQSTQTQIDDRITSECSSSSLITPKSLTASCLLPRRPLLNLIICLFQVSDKILLVCLGAARETDVTWWFQVYHAPNK